MIVANAADYATKHFDETLELLKGYLQIPAISCDERYFPDVEKLANHLVDALKQRGFADAQKVCLERALPLVIASDMSAGPEAKTIVIYGHFDLQPVEGEDWDSDPHEPEVRNGRLYARGSADDMGGWVSHLAAIDAWRATNDAKLPVNVKFVLEGEEEIGSPNLERYMDEYPDAFEADVMILTDCENPSEEIPGLTVSLRGLYEVSVSCKALSGDVHSGLWGNMGPDAGNALTLLIARCLDENGRMKLGRMEPPESWRARAREVPLNDEVIRDGANLLKDAKVLPESGLAPAEWLWRQPALTILSTTLPRPGQEKNALRAEASAKLSIRLAPGQTREEMRAYLNEAFQNPPPGVVVELHEKESGAESWLYEPKGPAFEAVDRAYEAVWGIKPLEVGIGGSIPFVAIFGRRFSDLPLILNGVMDPKTGAHGPNESMSLEVFRKAICANVHLYDELSRI